MSRTSLVITLSGLLALGLVGCNVDRVSFGSRAPKDAPVENEPGKSSKLASATTGVDIVPVEAEEVDLVEAVLQNRADYHQSLTALRDYYKSHGYANKQSWADFELNGIKKVKAFRYIEEAEVPVSKLNPTESVAEADRLYEQGMELMRKGGHGTPLFYREKTMIQAADVLRDLIEKYPSSDKVDDAAFFLGEIHKEYMPGQEPIAVKWYERAWTWNAQTPHPARFQAAVVYDYRMHDRDRALELYKAVIAEESEIQSNVRFAQRRISELTTGKTAASALP